MQNEISTTRRMLETSFGLLSYVPQNTHPVIAAPVPRAFLILLCLLASFYNIGLVVEGMNALLKGARDSVMLTFLVATFCNVFLALTKQIWTNRMGGGTFLFIFFVLLWVFGFSVSIFTGWAVFSSTTVETLMQEAAAVGDDYIAYASKNFLSLSGALILSSAPILFGVIVFFAPHPSER